MKYLDLQIDFFVYTKFRTFDGTIVVDVVDNEFKIAAFSGVVDDAYEGESEEYFRPGCLLFKTFEAAALADPMLVAAVAEAVEIEAAIRAAA
jgi:hypothetical protein